MVSARLLGGIMYKLHYDNSTGEILGFYVESLHKNIPVPNIEITKEQHKNYFNQPYYKVINDELVFAGKPEVELAELKAAKWQKIKTTRDQKEQAGLPYMGKILDSDALSIQRITTAVQAAQMAVSLQQEFSVNWTTQDNSILVMTAQDVLAIPLALAKYSDSLHAKARSLREKIDKAATQEEVDAISWDS